MKRWLLAVLCLLWCASADAAVAYVTQVSGNVSGGASLTLAAVNADGSGGNIVYTRCRIGQAQTLSSSGVTFNGSSTGWTRLDQPDTTQLFPFDAAGGRFYVFWGVGLSGTHDIVITPSANSSIYCVATVLSGANTSTPIGTMVTNTGNAAVTDQTATATGTTDGLGIDLFYVDGTPTTVADGTQTNTTSLGAIDGKLFRTSTTAGAVTQTMGWTGVPNMGDGNMIVVIPVKASGGGGSTCVPSLALKGVGACG